MLKKKAGGKYIDRVAAKKSLDDRRSSNPTTYHLDATDEVFNTHSAS